MAMFGFRVPKHEEEALEPIDERRIADAASGTPVPPLSREPAPVDANAGQGAGASGAKGLSVPAQGRSEARLMTLDPAAGDVPSHVARHAGVKGMCALFERQTAPTAADTGAHQSAGHGDGADAKGPPLHAAEVTSSRRIDAGATPGDAAPAASDRAGAGAAELLDDDVADFFLARTGTGHSAADSGGAPAPSARDRWAKATRLVSHAARAFDRRWKGVSVGFLRRLREEVLAVPGGEALTTEDMCERLIKPACAASGGGAYVDAAPVPAEAAAVGDATVFVSHSWQFCLVEVLDQLIELGEREERVFFWFDLVMVDQTRGDALGPDFWTESFRAAISGIGRTVVLLAPWDNPLPISRAWCLFEIATTMIAGAELRFVLLDRERERLKNAILEDEDHLENAMVEVDARKARCTLERDKTRIFETIERMDGGFHELNVQVKERLREWVLLSARDMVTDVGVESSRCGGAGGGGSGDDGDQATAAVLGRLCANISEMVLDLNDYKGALDCALKSLEIRRRAFGDAHVDVADSLNKLGDVRCKIGDHAEAVSAHERALAAVDASGDTSVLAKRARLEANSGLANVFIHTAELDKAEESYRAAHRIATEVYGPDAVETARCRYGVGYALRLKGRLAEARLEYECALAALVAAKGEYHPVMNAVYNGLACILSEHNENEEAIRLFTKLLELKEEHLGRYHSSTATTHLNLGVALTNAGRHDEAMKHTLTSLRVKEALFGPDHISTATAYNNVAFVNQTMGKYELALEQHMEAANRYVAALHTEEHWRVVRCYNNIAKDLHGVGRPHESLERYEHALGIAKRVASGSTSLDMAVSLHGMGAVLAETGERKAAADCFRRALEMREASLPADHPAVKSSRNALAELEEQQ